MATTRPNSGSFTWDDFVNLDEDDLRELLDGDLVEIEVPSQTHEFIVARLVYSLTGWSDLHKAGRVLASGYKVRVSARRGVMPDIQFFRRDNQCWKNQEKGLSTGHPDLAIKVVSTTSRGRDRVTKPDWYAAIGVPEYWVFDPEAQIVERLVLRDGLYSLSGSAQGNEVFRPETFPGLEISLAQLWESEDAPSEGEGGQDV